TTDASPERYTPAIAAAISGMMANALDYDDTLYGHPGSVIVPTALTTSHYLNASGGDVLSAVVAGYEVAGRLGKACSPSAESRKLAWGIGSRHAPAAAATTALLLKLDLNQTAHALAISASNSPVSSINKTVYSSLGPTMSKNNFAMS